MSGSADASCKVWDARTAQVKHSFAQANPVRSCGFSYSGNLVMYTTDSTLKENCYIIVRDLREPGQLHYTTPYLCCVGQYDES